MPSYLFDTNIFNNIRDGAIELTKFYENACFYATHVQLDELRATSNTQRRQELITVFEEVAGNKVPTESFVLGFSRLDEAKLGDEENDLYSKIKAELDERNKNKPNNIQDALIAETAIKNGFTLATHDSDLFLVATKYRAACANIHQVLLDLNRQLAT